MPANSRWDLIRRLRVKNGVINKMYVGVEVKRYAFMALVPSWRARLLTMRKETDEARR